MSSTSADGGDIIDGQTGDTDTIAVAAGQSVVFNAVDTNIQRVENISLGNGSSVTLTGQSEGFTITGGGSSGGTVVASDGADSITGGVGNDTITGGIGQDTIDGASGNDVVSVSDVTFATSHGLTGILGMVVNLSSDAISDTGTAGDLDDVMDEILGAAGAYQSLLVGSTQVAGNTVQYFGTAAKGANYLADTLIDMEGAIGSTLSDYIVLGTGGMSANGGAGADFIRGGSGVDTIDGGTGNDVIEISEDSDHSAGEVITGGDGTDVIYFASTEAGTLVLSAGVTGVERVAIADGAGLATGTSAENVNAGALTAAIQLTGNAGINELTGSAFADTITGNAGADVLRGGGGNDTFNADNDDTLVDGGDGTDVLALAVDATFLAAELANVETVTLASDAELTVDYTDVAGANNITTITGVNDGNVEKLIVTGASAGAGSVTLDFSSLVFTDATLDVNGGSDIEVITGTSGADDIDGGAGADIINGGDGVDLLTGGAGNDQLNGGAGNDTILGSAGADALNGGTGADTFRFGATDSLEASYDSITGFEAVLVGADTLDFTAVDGDVTADVAGPGVDVKAAIVGGSATDVVTAVVTNGLITLLGANATEIDTLAEWIDVAETAGVIVDEDVAAFAFNGNTYVVQVDASASTQVIELVGLTGIVGVSDTAASTNSILIA